MGMPGITHKVEGNQRNGEGGSGVTKLDQFSGHLGWYLYEIRGLEDSPQNHYIKKYINGLRYQQGA